MRITRQLTASLLGTLVFRAERWSRPLGVAAVMFIPIAITQNAAPSSTESATRGGVSLKLSSPGPSPRGLASDGTHLWLADDQTNTIYKLDSATGAVLSSFSATGFQPRGLTWDGTHLWSLDNATQKIYELDPRSGSVISTIDAPVVQATGAAREVAGLAWDGTHLWSGCVAGWSSKMYQLDPKDGSVKRSYFTKGFPRALATDGTFLWSATDNGGMRSGLIYKYKLSDGSYVSQIDAPGRFPVALVFDGQWLWYADGETRAIYRLSSE